MIYTDYIRLRDKSDDSKKTGVSVALLPEGGTAPGELITLSANAELAWQYDFPAAVESGIYDLYINGVPSQINGVTQKIPVARDGKITPNMTTFGF